MLLISLINKVKRFITSPSERFSFLASLGFYNSMPDEEYIKIKYKLMTGRELNLQNPETFREKIQWLKLFNRQPEYTRMVDKYAVKQYVSDRIGSDHVIPTFGVWDSFDKIDFSKLPNQFVLKCTHDSGGLVICTDKNKLDIHKARNKINKCMRTDYYPVGREWPYKNVPHRIICEKFMQDQETEELRDYKFYCFDGKVKLFMINTDRNKSSGTKADYFDSDLKHVDLFWGYECADIEPELPANIKDMISIAEELSSGIPHLRVDLYNCNGCILFGELTFFDGSGFDIIEPIEWDYKLGSWIQLPAIRT